MLDTTRHDFFETATAKKSLMKTQISYKLTLFIFTLTEFGVGDTDESGVLLPAHTTLSLNNKIATKSRVFAIPIGLQVHGIPRLADLA